MGSLLDLTADDLWNEFGGEAVEGNGGSFALDDLNHLLADGSDLRRGGICGLLNLVGATLGESDSEDAEEVVVGGLDRDVGLDQSLPLSYKRSELVGCEIETVEVGQTVLSLDLIDA